MSYNQFGQPGFGVGAYYGVPVTVGTASSISTTITGTAYATRQYLVALNQSTPSTTDANLVRLEMVTTSGGVTGTYMIGGPLGGQHFYNDNQSFRINNTSSISIQVVLIPA